MGSEKQKTAIVTGAAGFIGFHVARRLLEEGWRVVGVDCLTDYYDVRLKEQRESMILKNKSYRSVHEKIETQNMLIDLFKNEQPDVVIHLAAQAGVRYSIVNPRAYLESNIIGTFELLEAARMYPPQHMLLASTSSAYGANQEMPYTEIAKADHQMSFYASTKKSMENIAHSYSHLFNLPVTVFRFFTVYGPWGRPDMALFKFTRAILNDKPIDVYNNGCMKRDFTYIDDIVQSIYLLINVVPKTARLSNENLLSRDSISPVAPFRTINIGNEKPQELTDFIKAVEAATGKSATKNFLPMQPGDVFATWADTSLLEQLTGFKPRTELGNGVKQFIEWYQEHYGIEIIESEDVCKVGEDCESQAANRGQMS